MKTKSSKQPESLILMRQAFKKPESLKDVSSHFCPGCHHGIAHRLIAEAIDFFGIQGKTIGVASVGCSVFLYDYFDIDVVDPAYAPGTGTPQIGGLSSFQALQLVRALKGLDFIGFDLVEVSPPYDSSGITALLAANIMYEILCVVSLNQ